MSGTAVQLITEFEFGSYHGNWNVVVDKLTVNPRPSLDRSSGLGAQPRRIGNMKDPLRARFVYYSSVLYRIILRIH